MLFAPPIMHVDRGQERPTAPPITRRERGSVSIQSFDWSQVATDALSGHMRDVSGKHPGNIVAFSIRRIPTEM